MSQRNKGWAYRSKEGKPGDYYILSMTKNETAMNLWHFTPEHEYLYSFIPNEKYHRGRRWCWEKCRKLEENMRSQKPKVTVVRFMADGVAFFHLKGFGNKECPEPPTHRALPPEWDDKSMWMRYPSVPAPFILYGVHDTAPEKEYAWGLTPDIPERQGIVPGDRVLVFSRNRYVPITVTRIEPAEGDEQPRCSVARKLPPDVKKS